MKTGIQVKTAFFPLAFLFSLCTPVIEINGEKNIREWGSHNFELSPGYYNVKIYFSYLFKSECGANQIKINLIEGQVKRIEFNMPPWINAKGNISSVSE